MEGIEHCENLTFLNIAGNPIVDMSVLSKMTYLETLIIGYIDPADEKSYPNDKIDISTLGGLTTLKALHLSAFHGQNKDTKPDISILSKLTNLTSLQLVFNGIEDISPLSKLTNLKSLALQYNKIKDLTPLAGLTNLIRLVIGNNLITDISPLSKLTNLRILNVSRNQISNIQALSDLKKLGDMAYITKNMGDDIELAWIRKDKALLWLGGNNIKDISPLLANYNNGGLRKLSRIYLRNNYMDITPGSENRKVVDTLIQAGIDVVYEERNLIQANEKGLSELRRIKPVGCNKYIWVLPDRLKL